MAKVDDFTIQGGGRGSETGGWFARSLQGRRCPSSSRRALVALHEH